jgi:hypothetical protein
VPLVDLVLEVEGRELPGVLLGVEHVAWMAVLVERGLKESVFEDVTEVFWAEGVGGGFFPTF